MADQPITGLPTKTASGVASTDKMLCIDSAEGYQILVRDVAKYIIENCDVSTLAGSVKTPKAAIDALNNKPSITSLGTEITDCNNATSPGVYRIMNMSTAQNIPDGTGIQNYTAELYAICRATASRVFQMMFVYITGGLPRVFVRAQSGVDSFSAWKEL